VGGKLFGSAAGDQPFDHLAGADAINIGDDPAQFDPGIIEQLVRAVFFSSRDRR
jgi:hypothetical protein